MRSDKVIWGLIFVFAGTVLLLDNFGIIDFYWSSLWRLWPLLLVIWGSELIFSGKKNPAGVWIAGLITVIVLVFAGYYGSTHVADDSRWMRHFRWEGHGRHSTGDLKINSFSEPLSGNVNRAELNISGGATLFKLRDSTANLFEARVQHRLSNYSLTRVTRDSTEVLSLKASDSTHAAGPRNFGLNRVEMRLHSKPEWNINMEMGAGKADLDLSAFRVASLTIEGGAASFQVKLGDRQPASDVTVNAGASKVRISIPASAGCLIKVNSALSSNRFKGFTKQDDGTYITANYNSSVNKIVIDFEGGVSDFEVRRY